MLDTPSSSRKTKFQPNWARNGLKIVEKLILLAIWPLKTSKTGLKPSVRIQNFKCALICVRYTFLFQKNQVSPELSQKRRQNLRKTAILAYFWPQHFCICVAFSRFRHFLAIFDPMYHSTITSWQVVPPSAALKTPVSGFRSEYQSFYRGPFFFRVFSQIFDLS